MAKIENELTWSVSRAQLFQNCQRAYYYNYYASWGGWSKDASPETILAYQLKNLKPMILWAGGIVHETIKEALTQFASSGTVPTAEALQAAARAKMNAGWLECIHQEWKTLPSKKTNLFELYYGNPDEYGTCTKLPREQTDAIKQRVMDALDAFAHAPVLKTILATPTSNWKVIDELSNFFIGPIKVWCAVDFAYTDEDGVLHIIDWKTGNEHKATLRQQLACYALFACKIWDASLEKLTLQGVFLNDGGRLSTYPIAPDLLTSVTSQIEASYASMKSKLSDPEKNIAEIDSFPPSPSEYNCQTCPFRRLCIDNA